jgi:ribosomal protein S27AE
MSPETVEALCEKCGQSFTAFLEEMAAHNEKVVCPKCAAAEDCGPAVAAKNP